LELNSDLCFPEDTVLYLNANESVALPGPGKYLELSFLTWSRNDHDNRDVSIFEGEYGETAAVVNSIVYGDESLVPSSPVTKNVSTASISLPIDPCASTAYSIGYAKWNKAMQWWYAPKFEPSSYARNRVGSSLQSWVRGISSCFPLNSPTQLLTSFQGNTSLAPVATASSKYCSFSEGKSVVGWAPLAAIDLGETCTWGEYPFSQSLSEADITLNSDANWFLPETSNGCSGQYNLQHVATHEFGHAIGLGHVDQNSGQVMAPYSSPCDFETTTLGLGDLKGVLSRYGN
jgi:hypothetical protein